MLSNKRLQATTVDVDMLYAVELPVFLGEVRVTDTDQIIHAVFDSASDWLVVPDSGCGSCKGAKVFNSNARKTSTIEGERRYSSANLKGYTYKDKVCLTSARDSCIESFKYFSFVKQAGLNFPIEGIIGMAQQKQMRLSTTEYEIGPLFTAELYKADQIPEPSFSFGINGYSNNDPSFVDIGKPDATRVNGKIINTSTTISLQMNDDFFWSTQL